MFCSLFLFSDNYVHCSNYYYCRLIIIIILAASRNLKKRKYCATAESFGSTFTPVIATCEAIFDIEAEVYIKKLASLLAHKWKKSYSVIACYIRARMQVAILRSVSLCIRGTRLKWRSAVIDDGAGIPRLQED